MAENDSTTIAHEEQTPQSEYLGDLMERSFWPLNSFINTLEDDESYSALLTVLVPLLDGAKANLDILDNVLEQSFGGPIKVETKDTLRFFGQYSSNNFGKAFVG